VHTIKAFLEALTLAPTGDGQYMAPNVDSGLGFIFGGQLLAQSIVAAVASEPEKRVKTLHTVFARAASPDAPVELAVEPTHRGRTLSSSTVTISQGDRLCTRSLVLLNADEDSFIHHADEPPQVPGPDASAAPTMDGDWEVRIAGDVDISDPDLTGPPELNVWTRFAGAPADPVISQALLAYATDGFLIGTSMRPHKGVGQSLAHKTLSTGVLSHTLTFHEPFSAGEWLLLANHGTYSGHGRCYGRANIFRADGTLVASYVQDGMIRPMSQGSKL
jgi:acyl-CoA thioesterase